MLVGVLLFGWVLWVVALVLGLMYGGFTVGFVWFVVGWWLVGWVCSCRWVFSFAFRFCGLVQLLVVWGVWLFIGCLGVWFRLVVVFGLCCLGLVV